MDNTGIGAADHLYNNSIDQCPETRSICSAQITPPPRTLLDVSPRFSPDSVDNQQYSHSMTEARPRKQVGDARDSVDNRWLSTDGRVPILYSGYARLTTATLDSTARKVFASHRVV